MDVSGACKLRHSCERWHSETGARESGFAPPPPPTTTTMRYTDLLMSDVLLYHNPRLEHDSRVLPQRKPISSFNTLSTHSPVLFPEIGDIL